MRKQKNIKEKINMIDREKLIEMMDGDDILADKMIQVFKNSAKTELSKIKEYFELLNFDSLENAAHVMKTQAAYMGLDHLHKLSEDIENQARKRLVSLELERNLNELEVKLKELIHSET